MKKILTLFLLVFIGCLLAGVYGILHDQLTYSIAPEYYTKFKFHQFELVDTEGEAILPNPRVAVAAVGFMATWWMGLFVGMILGAIGTIHATWRSMFQITFTAFLINILIAFVVALIGLVYGYVFLSDNSREEFGNWFIPDNLIDFKSFIAVGSMHNFSYLGGVVGLIVAMGYSVWKRPARKRYRFIR